jgi:outer membrane protein
MLKKILFTAALVFSATLGAMAQGDAKIAYVTVDEVFALMPEISDYESSLATLNETYKNEMAKMEEEYGKKYSDFIAIQDSLPENIKIRRMQEVQELQQRIENFAQVAQQDMQKKQQELIAPIQKKLEDTIKIVSEENGYTYVLNRAALLFVGANSVDATPLVKQKLGIK